MTIQRVSKVLIETVEENTRLKEEIHRLHKRIEKLEHEPKRTSGST